MEKLFFNVILEEPKSKEQLVHLDIYPNAAIGYIVQAIFYGKKIDDDTFEIRKIKFYVEEVDLRVRTPGNPRKFYKISEKPGYKPDHTDSDTTKTIKQISFEFDTTNPQSSKPQMEAGYDEFSFQVKRGEKMDFHIVPGIKPQPKLKEITGKSKAINNVNSHICDVIYYF